MEDETDDRATLVALYNATNGPNWKNNTNWLSDKPLGEWFGVTTDASGRVTELQLGDNRLTGTIPSSLGNLTNLRLLWLAYNQLSGSIPSSLGNLTNLQVLDLSNNRLTGTIPSQLGNLTNLELLLLQNNQLSGCVPAGLRGLRVGTHDLDFLDLPDCGLSDTIPEKTELKHPKVGSALDELIARIEAGEISEEEAAQEAPLHRGKSVAVTIYLSSNVDGVVSFLKANGVSPRNVGEDYIEAFVPVLLLRDISDLTGVLYVQPIILPQPPQGGPQQQIGGNGPAVHGSLDWNRAGFTGQGIKVGIIDSGFIGFSELMGTELPGVVAARCYRRESDLPTTKLRDCERTTDHGTASAETIIDIAPEASLYIANASTKGDTEDAVKWMISNDVKVINGSLRRMFDGPGDGTSPYSNSPLNVLDRAVKAGIVWINSAGNDARTTWYGTPSDTNGNGFLEFSSGKEEITVRWRESIWAKSLQLRWEGNWGGESRDLDLYIYDKNEQIVAESIKPQSGETWHNANELVFLGAGTYKVRVATRGNDLPQWIQLLSMSGSFDQYTENGSMTSPAESANPGMLAVGAAHWRRPDTIESYSSRGPAPDGRVKPDIVGAACGETATYTVYCGTSQASPQVAGMAALVRQRFPNYTPAQVANYLKDNAEQRGFPRNNTWGHGFAVLPPLQERTVPDRAALVALYQATDGDNWQNNDNWLSNKPLDEWYGVTTDASGRVTRLDLFNNRLSGSIPSSLGNLTNLQELWLFDNELSGSIPSSLGNLTNLQGLWLFDNELSGSIPSSLGNLTNLQGLGLRNNQLSGCIPAGLRDVESNDLDLLGLSDCGGGGRTVPDRAALVALYQATDGDNWQNNDNWLSNKPLDEWYGVTTDASGRVTRLVLGSPLSRGNDLLGSIPQELGGLSNLEVLQLSRNDLSGSIPSSLGNLSNLQRLALNGNELSGSIPSSLGNLTNLRELRLHGNDLSGSIPSSLGNLTNLQRLDLYHNDLSGSIPSSLGNLTNLRHLWLGDNRLSGSIPSSLGNLTNLQVLALYNNRLSGSIPSSLGNLTNLRELRLRNNDLSGSIPSSLGNLTNLQLLQLRANQLSGCIPAGLRDVENNDLDALGLSDCAS